ncbi:MAG: site-specific integrase [Terrimicrobiaceae bacterium]
MLDDLLKWFQDQGYTTSTIRNHIQGIDELARLLERRHEGLIRLNKAQLNAAYDYFHHRKPGVAGTIRAIGRFLCERKLLAEERREAVSHSERELELFGAYLRDARGLAERTIEGHQNRLRSFLGFLKFNQRPSVIRALKTKQIEAFVRRAAKTNNRFSLQHVIASLRAFLQRQHALGILSEPLHQRIDTPRVYRLEQLPRALPWEQVVALLRSIDRSTPAGLEFLSQRPGECGEAPGAQRGRRAQRQASAVWLPPHYRFTEAGGLRGQRQARGAHPTAKKGLRSANASVGCAGWGSRPQSDSALSGQARFGAGTLWLTKQKIEAFASLP